MHVLSYSYEKKRVCYCYMLALHTFHFPFTTLPALYIVYCAAEVTDPVLKYDQRETEYFICSFLQIRSK